MPKFPPCTMNPQVLGLFSEQWYILIHMILHQLFERRVCVTLISPILGQVFI